MKTFLQITLSLLLATLLFSCNGSSCKIDPPPAVVGTDKEAGANVAASALGAAISNGSLAANYKNIVNKTYVTVDKDDVAFYLLLQAYNCESERGHLAQADALLVTAREQLARRNNSAPTMVASHPTTLTPVESKVLKKSPLKTEISATLAKPKAPRKPKTKAPADTASKPAATPKPSPSPSA